MIAGLKIDSAYLVTRAPWQVFSGPAAASLGPFSALPAGQDVRLQVTVTGGASNSGTVTILGSRDGAAAGPEDLEFSSPVDQLRGTYLMDIITSITTSGLANESPKPNILVEALDSGGAPIMAETLTPIKIRWKVKTTWLQKPEGGWELRDSQAFVPVSVGTGDVIQFDPANPTDPTDGDYFTVQKILKTSRGFGSREILRLVQF